MKKNKTFMYSVSFKTTTTTKNFSLPPGGANRGPTSSEKH